MKRKGVLALLFFCGIAFGLIRIYRGHGPHESTPPGLRELMLSSIQNGRLDITRLRLAAPWDRLCLLPAGTTDAEAHRKLPFLKASWNLAEHSGVENAPVTALLLLGAGNEPVGVADLPTDRIRFDVAGGACLARASASFPARH